MVIIRASHPQDWYPKLLYTVADDLIRMLGKRLWWAVLPVRRCWHPGRVAFGQITLQAVCLIWSTLEFFQSNSCRPVITSINEMRLCGFLWVPVVSGGRILRHGAYLQFCSKLCSVCQKGRSGEGSGEREEAIELHRRRRLGFTHWLPSSLRRCVFGVEFECRFLWP